MIEAIASERNHMIESTNPDLVDIPLLNNEDWYKWYSLPRTEKYERLSEHIGNTPVDTITIELDAETKSTVNVKSEYENLSGSHYDRAYLETLRHFEEIGFIQPGDELRDISSGSAGISLARIASLLDYKVTVVVPDELPDSRVWPMEEYGATVLKAGPGYVPAAAMLQLKVINKFRDDPSMVESRPNDRSGRAIAFERDYGSIDGEEFKYRVCFLNHSENDITPRAFSSIADEIIGDVPGVSHLVLAEGNWTTIAGIAPRLRELVPNVKIFGYHGEVNNDGSTENFGTLVPNVPIRFRDMSLLDGSLLITNKERETMRTFAPHLGHSSLMGLRVAGIISHNYPGAVVVSLGYDRSDRY